MSMEFEKRPEEQPERAEEDYSFLQETIKEDQMNGRKFLRKGLRVICYGFLFGVACFLGFHVFGSFSENFRNSSSGQVLLEKEGSEESVSVGTEKEETDNQQDIQKEELELNPENYKTIYEKLKDVCSKIEPSITAVCGYADDESSTVSAYGCVLAKNNNQVLLMTCSHNLSAAKKIEVEFYGGQTVEASIRKQYDILNIAVLQVDTDELTETTKRLVKPANLGTSVGTESGDSVLVLGNIYGFPGSVGYGMIQDVSGEIQKEDGLYYRMKTDIQGTKGGSGIMVNLEGDVIGIVSSASADEDEKVSGIGISSLKSVLEFLLNGKDVPYTGVTGTEVTEEAAEKQELPEGVYVQSVSADSPAMIAGIKSGDIITAVNGEELTTMEGYHRILMKNKSGSSISIQVKRRGKDGYVNMDFKVELMK